MDGVFKIIPSLTVVTLEVKLSNICACQTHQNQYNFDFFLSLNEINVINDKIAVGLDIKVLEEDLQQVDISPYGLICSFKMVDKTEIYQSNKYYNVWGGTY